jgi:hypothetical protein
MSANDRTEQRNRSAMQKIRSTECRLHSKRTPFIACVLSLAGLAVAACAGDDGSAADIAAVAQAAAPSTAACEAANVALPLRGTMTVTTNGETSTGSFVLLEDGSFRFDVTYPSGETISTAFDATSLSSNGLATDASGKRAGPGSLSMTGQALSGPYAQMSLLDYYLHQSMARGLAAAADGEVAKATYDVSPEDQASSGYAGDDSEPSAATVTASVNVAAAVACDVQITSGDLSTSTVVEGLERFVGTREVLHVADPVPDTLPGPVDAGFRTIERATAADLVPYTVVLPEEPLPGFALVWIGHAKEAAGADGTAPDVLTAVYRNAGREIVVTQQSLKPDSSPAVDPYRVVDVSGAGRRSGRSLPTGVEGLTLIDASSDGTLPHAWGSALDMLVSIGGDLNAEELASVAQSLDG